MIHVNYRLRAIKDARSAVQRAANLGAAMIGNDAKAEAGALLLDLSSQVGHEIAGLLGQEPPKGREAKKAWTAATERLEDLTAALTHKIQEVI